MASPKRRTRRASPKKRSTRRDSPKKRSTKRMSPKKRSTKSKSKRRVSRKCTSPKSSKACKQLRKKMRGGSSCGTQRQQGGSSCGTHKGAGYGKQKAGVKNSGMDSQSGNSRPKRASAVKASIAMSKTRKDREERSKKIKLTKEFKKTLDVEIDRLADMMGKSTASVADDFMDSISIYMNKLTMGPRQQQSSSSSKQLPPSRLNFLTRQPSRTEYTAQDVLARFK